MECHAFVGRKQKTMSLIELNIFKIMLGFFLAQCATLTLRSGLIWYLIDGRRKIRNTTLIQKNARKCKVHKCGSRLEVESDYFEDTLTKGDNYKQREESSINHETINFEVKDILKLCTIQVKTLFDCKCSKGEDCITQNVILMIFS